jgi:hypothetical protein
MAANYVLLEKVTVGAAGASSITFNNIPQTGYTDLKIVASMRTSEALGANSIWINFNGSATGFSAKVLEGSGSAASSYSQAKFVGTYEGTSYTANTFSNTEIYIPNYTSGNYKSYSADSVTENNGSAAYSELTAGLWSNNAAITSVTLYSGSGGTMVQYCTFSLYGLAAVGTTPVIAPYASGGDIIQTDGTYWYHAFLASGSFTPNKALSCDILQVAGGGGGGNFAGGGGGAGGVLGFASQSLAANTAQTVTVGAGGTGSPAGTDSGTNGVNSQFASLTASVGGGVGSQVNIGTYPGASGGSGGGGNYSQSAGSGTSGQGNAGGVGTSSGANYLGGGGGGAGAAGSNAPSGSAGGAGGAGVNTYTNATWLSTALSTTGLGVSGYIAGGGGGGTGGSGSNSRVGGAGGSGGGGAGGNSQGNGGVNHSGNAGVAGTSNTGSGGGGAGTNDSNATANPGGNGGSGVVIIRYAI